MIFVLIVGRLKCVKVLLFDSVELSDTDRFELAATDPAPNGFDFHAVFFRYFLAAEILFHRHLLFVFLFLILAFCAV